eukprot:TRINITY_DN4864_c2_g1_i1.p3 TRINITY_DN4864_c2_g1~~TRINITY_DN4864_c2_g1_i1.p3  ORF type:complete len:131 (-),score=18.03 TRINITY_DN4864_c2_g1_i1:547-939(-)
MRRGRLLPPLSPPPPIVALPPPPVRPPQHGAAARHRQSRRHRRRNHGRGGGGHAAHAPISAGRQPRAGGGLADASAVTADCRDGAAHATRQLCVQDAGATKGPLAATTRCHTPPDGSGAVLSASSSEAPS